MRLFIFIFPDVFHAFDPNLIDCFIAFSIYISLHENRFGINQQILFPGIAICIIWNCIQLGLSSIFPEKGRGSSRRSKRFFFFRKLFPIIFTVCYPYTFRDASNSNTKIKNKNKTGLYFYSWKACCLNSYPQLVFSKVLDGSNSSSSSSSNNNNNNSNKNSNNSKGISLAQKMKPPIFQDPIQQIASEGGTWLSELWNLVLTLLKNRSPYPLMEMKQMCRKIILKKRSKPRILRTAASPMFNKQSIFVKIYFLPNFN